VTGRTLFLAVLLCPAADSSWLRLESPHFELVTSAGAGSGREALRRLEQIRNVFESRTQQKNLTPLPVRIFLFRSESEFRPYQVNENAAGYYSPGPDRDYIAMQAGGADLYRIVFHEYVHLMMRHAGVHVPVWLNEGTAEVYSTLELHGSEVRIGELIPAHIATLRSETLLDLKLLLSVDHSSPHYNEREKTGIFYAQSWALAHMLNFSPAYQAGTANLISMLASGEEPARAFQQAFGKGLNSVRSDLLTYIRRDRFAGIRFEAKRPRDLGKIEAAPIADVDSTLLLSDLLINIRRAEQADGMLQELAGRHPDRPEVQAALGDAALRRHEDLVAKRHYERAMELGSTSGRLRYDYALVQRELGIMDSEIVRSLTEAVQLDPRLFDAHYLLGYMELKAERHAEAVKHLETASELRPLRASVWEHLALAYHGSGNRANARAAARKARKLAVTPEDIARTEATLRLVESDAIVQAQPPAPAPERPHWARPGSVSRVEGTLIQVDCLDEKARLHVLHPGGKMFLLVSYPRQVVLRGSEGVSTELACGPVTPRRVAIEYRRSASASWGTEGEVSSIEFR
jgi:Flp pilus assembly protein TadD